MNYRTPVADLGDAFLSNPLDFTMEADMQCRLVEYLRNMLDAEDSLTATTANTPVSDDGNYAQYKRPYIDRIIDRSTTGSAEVTRVHPEVNVTARDTPNQQIDVVVLDETLSAPIRWNGGSKRFAEQDVAAAFELKFVTNQNVISHDFDTATLTNATESEMRSQKRISQLDTENRKLQSDLDRMNELPSTETYLVIFSHYNYLFQPDLLDGASATKRKNRKVGWTVDAWLSEEAANGSTDILYVHPGGSTWWT